jgi:hypothetical protein
MSNFEVAIFREVRGVAAAQSTWLFVITSAVLYLMNLVASSWYTTESSIRIHGKGFQKCGPLYGTVGAVTITLALYSSSSR